MEQNKQQLLDIIKQLDSAISDLHLVTCVNYVSYEFKLSAIGTLSNVKEDIEDMLK